MNKKKRPVGITLLAILAVIAALVSFYDTLQFLGILPFSLGPLDFFGVSLLGAFFAGILGLIYLWVAISLWNLRPEGWLFSVSISAISLIFAVLAIIGQSSVQAMLPAIIIYGVILLYCLRPGVKDAFETPRSPVAATAAMASRSRPGVSEPITQPVPPAVETTPDDIPMEAEPAVADLASTETSMEVTAPALAATGMLGASVESDPQPIPVEPSAPSRARRIRVDEIEGIGPTYAATLAQAGIVTTEDLLEAGATPAGRDRLVQETGLSHVNLFKWINLADLMRVPGIGEEYSQLLEVAGVDTVKELRTRNPTNLHKSLVDASSERNLVRRPPHLSEVEAWVEAAGALEPRITY